MNPYSHLVLASILAEEIVPEDPPEYYWGAVAPDIRYLSSIPRSQTHLPPHTILAYLVQFPQLKSFLQGYLVHCLADEIPMEAVFYGLFPFSVLKRWLSRPHLAVILELFNFEHAQTNIQVSGAYNQVLYKIGLQEQDCTKFANFIHRYMDAPISESRIIELIRLLGLDKDERLDKYVAAGERFQGSRSLRSILFYRLQSANINDLLANWVSERLKEVMVV